MPEYEVKRVSRQTSYELSTFVSMDHPFGYYKRRDKSRTTKYTDFRPFCSCGWKSKTWYPNKELAGREHVIHAVEFTKSNPKLKIEGLL
jgi:hypothetical protein